MIQIDELRDVAKRVITEATTKHKAGPLSRVADAVRVGLFKSIREILKLRIERGQFLVDAIRAAVTVSEDRISIDCDRLLAHLVPHAKTDPSELAPSPDPG